MKSVLFTLSLIVLSLFASAQQCSRIYGIHDEGGFYHFGALNPASGFSTLFDTLSQTIQTAPISSTYDAINDHYIYRDLDTDVIYVIDAGTGSTLNTFPPNPYTLHSPEFDPVSGKLFGLHVDGIDHFFTSLDLTTGATTLISLLPGVTLINHGSTFDPVNGRYFFVKADEHALVEVDISTGNILNQFPANPYDINLPEYNVNSGKIIAIEHDGPSLFKLHSLDLTTGISSLIDTVQGITGLIATGHTFDYNQQHYIVNSGSSKVVMIDITDASVVASFPQSPHATYYPEYAVCVANPNGIHEMSDENNTKVYPNPFHDVTRIEFDNPQGSECYLSMYNSVGKMVQRIDHLRSSHVTIDGNNLSAGVYHFQIMSKTGRVGVGKVVVE